MNNIKELYNNLKGLLQIHPEYVHLIDYKYFPDYMQKYFDIIKSCINTDGSFDVVKYHMEIRNNNIEIEEEYGIMDFESLYSNIKKIYLCEILTKKIKTNIIPNLSKYDYDNAVANIISIQNNLENIKSDIETLPQISQKMKELITRYSDDDNSIKTLIPTLDYKLHNIHKKQYFIIAGRPHMGKTTFALQLAYNFIKQGKRILYFAFEQSSEMLANQLCGIANQKDFYNISSDEIDKFIAEYSDKIVFVNRPMNIYDITLNIKSFAAQHKLDIIFIDYVGLIKPHSNNTKKHEIISDISKEIKRLTMEDFTIFALAQINRGVENFRDKRPTLAYLKESGSLEEDADKILLLYRPGYYNKNKPSNEMEVILAKNRGVGITGTIRTKLINNRVVEIENIENEYDLPF